MALLLGKSPVSVMGQNKQQKPTSPGQELEARGPSLGAQCLLDLGPGEDTKFSEPLRPYQNQMTSNRNARGKVL